MGPRRGNVLGVVLLSSGCGEGNGPSPAPPDPDRAAIGACREAARASSGLVAVVSEQLENRVEGSPETERGVRRAVRRARDPIERCNEFAPVDNAQVQACGRAAQSGLKATEAILKALDASAQDVPDLYVVEAEFYLEQHAEALGECGI